jgi:repressor LexA
LAKRANYERSYSNFERILSEKQITQYRVATDLGFSPMLLSDWKLDKSKPKYDTMVAIVKYLGVDMEQFTDSKSE